MIIRSRVYEMQGMDDGALNDLLTAQKADPRNQIVLQSIQKLNQKRTDDQIIKASVAARNNSESLSQVDPLNTRTSSLTADPTGHKDEDQDSITRTSPTFKTMKASLHPKSPSFIKLDDTSSNSNFDFNDVMDQSRKSGKSKKTKGSNGSKAYLMSAQDQNS